MAKLAQGLLTQSQAAAPPVVVQAAAGLKAPM